jgi:hypothetical protein
MNMGEVVAFKKPEPAAAAAPTARRRDRGKPFLVVPVRALDALRAFEESLDEFAADKRMHPDWNAFYQLAAILDFAPRYEP